MHTILKFPVTTKFAFLSDIHYGHDREFLWKPRGFNSVDEHSEFIVDNWRKHIDEDTIVFNLGDICFNDAKGNNFRMISNLPCKTQYVLWGNHCSGQNQCYKEAKETFFNDLGVTNIPDVEIYPLPFNNMVFCGNDLVIRIGKTEVHLSHFAKRIWDHMANRKSLHFSGHSHGNDSGRNPSTGTGKCLDVGIENAINETGNIFFTYEQLVDILDKREVELHDHHDTSTQPSR